MVAHDLHAGLIVSCSEWEDGQPVLILSAHTGRGRVAVRYQDARAHHPAHLAEVDPGFEIDLIGSCTRRPR
ncbi:hypothetical protein ABT340_39245 [Streptosporangium sp. NPDC000239]|uniref:hypothetical protein n=1 Tax=Streptosporangium sp. NPDC000239 TaxID=3154248 RepID=UPI00332FCEC2